MRRIATALLALAASMASVAHAAPPPMQTVESVDLKRYAGMWYEIANFPMVFQRDCVGDTTAEYTLHPDGSVGVNNRCRNKDGEVDSASGTATVVEGSNNAKLEVTFLPLQGRLLDHRPGPGIPLGRGRHARPQVSVDPVALAPAAAGRAGPRAGRRQGAGLSAG